MRSLSERMQQAIAGQFARVMEDLPAKKREVEAWLAGRDSQQALCMQFLYAYLPLSDVLTFSPEQLEGEVTAALRAKRELPYGASVPMDLFLNYVLMPRVNNEHLDGSRRTLQEVLWPRVQGKTMEAAALEVNYWCLEHATYHPSDDRTLGPLAVMRSTLGRCGEESTFTVAALRSVGIPARQCYVPWWSHCDDNHAWVELWAEGGWHYLGACEPEPVLDKGWFTAAASRAMVVHSRALSPLTRETGVVERTCRRALIHSTERYASCVTLTVQVLDHGMPAPRVEVQFQLINYSRCVPVYETTTDEHGRAVFSTGKGGLLLQIRAGDRLLTRPVDTRREIAVTVDLIGAETPAEKHGRVELFDLTPPDERVIGERPDPEQAAHSRRLEACDAARGACIRGFSADRPPEWKGNWPELEQFLKNNEFSQEVKEELLSTLRPKDFLDCTAEMLRDTLACALPYRAKFPPELYRSCVLAPRVANEMLLPVRSAIRAQVQGDFQNGWEVLDWLRQRVQVADDGEMSGLVPDCAKALAHGCINQSAFGVLFVTVCRTVGIPARQNPNTLAYEWLDADGAHPIDGPEDRRLVPLKLKNAGSQPLPYRERFTLARFCRERYEPLAYEGLTLEDTLTLWVPAGAYLLTVTTRQIDGTISARLCYVTVERETELSVLPPEDQTADRIRQVPLHLPEGPIRAGLQGASGRCMALFVEPGKEPTEHLLQELLDCRAAYGNYGVRLFVSADADRQNPTLRRVLEALPHAVLLTADDPAGLQALRQVMGVGDGRLPFALALDDRGRGLYACANYNIHTARTLLNIQKLSEKKELI